MRSKLNTMSLDLPNLRQTEHLESAAIRQDGFLPIDEFVQAPGGTDDVHSGPDVQMIRIAQDDLRPHLVQFAGINSLYAALGAHGHINRRIDDPMRGCQPAQAGFRKPICFQEFEHRGTY